MSEDLKPNENLGTPDILEKMKRQLDAMEKKLDSLLVQTKPREFKRDHSSKPRHDHSSTSRFSKPKHAARKEKKGVSSEGKFYHGSPFAPRKPGAGKSKYRKKD